ncbi:hypothetical protein [Oceanicella actignis]|nr:hypothetical protein [Oceanicella actignis]
MNCEARAVSRFSPLQAFEAAQPPYRDLARFLVDRAGRRIHRHESGIFVIETDLDEAARQLVEASRIDALAYDAALWMAAECIRYGKKVPEPLREWAFFAITGRTERPKMKGRYPYALAWRDAEIVELVREVSRIFNLPVTASGDGGGESACAAVAEALRLMRLQPDSYQQIRRIWKNRNNPRSMPKWAR